MKNNIEIGSLIKFDERIGIVLEISEYEIDIEMDPELWVTYYCDGKIYSHHILWCTKLN